MNSKILLRISCAFCAFSWLFSPPVTECQTAEELIASDHVMISARVEPETVYVGQKVEVLIDVMTRNWFLEAPRLQADFEIPGAIVLPPESFGVNFSKRVDGETYAGQTRKLTLFPTAPGKYEVPPVKVTLVVAGPDMKPTQPITLHSPMLKFTASVPAAASGLGLVMATPRLTLNEKTLASLEDLHVGDSFDRRVTMTIDDSVAMLLPVLTFDAPEGIAVYPSRPERIYRRNRGQMSGTRIDNITYVLEQDGSFELPAITIHWWDLKADELKTEFVAALSLDVSPNPMLGDEHLAAPIDEFEDTGVISKDAMPKGRNLTLLLLGVLILVILSRPLLRASARMLHHLRRPSDPEREAWKRLRRSCRGKEPRAILAAFYHWFDLLPGITSPTWRSELKSAPSAIRTWLEHLERNQYGEEPGETKLAMPSALTRWRRLRLTELSAIGTVQHQPGLGPMNPSI